MDLIKWLVNLLLLLPSEASHSVAHSVAFIGNSFTFFHDMPDIFATLSASLGHDVIVASSTIGGCSIYAQLNNSATTSMLDERDWDYVVLQDHSTMMTVDAARSVYFVPAVEEIVQRFAGTSTKTVLYETWGYHSGSTADCPTGSSSSCFPLGSMALLTEPPCAEDDRWRRLTSTHDCMQYSIARGTFDAFERAGADVLSPAGLAFQLAGYSKGVTEDCVEMVDAEHADSAPLPFSLPLEDVGVDPADTAGIELFIQLPGGGWDIHPTMEGSYLVAAVFYSVLFGESPVGAWSDPSMSASDARALQELAAAVVLPRRDLFVVA